MSKGKPDSWLPNGVGIEKHNPCHNKKKIRQLENSVSGPAREASTHTGGIGFGVIEARPEGEVKLYKEAVDQLTGGAKELGGWHKQGEAVQAGRHTQAHTHTQPVDQLAGKARELVDGEKIREDNTRTPVKLLKF
ncbi:hypothetical protein BY996DRAFT_6447657 [Phakopsora pachyrhizi]|nr:hypothetical protein BY996DRAFT_6447657 [Phakopsora pachyrhizi]